MLSARLELEAEKSQAYFESLCKHFARKVQVKKTDHKATVEFPMAQCEMSVDQNILAFKIFCSNLYDLKTAKHIIESHALRYHALKESTINWKPIQN